MKRNMEHEIQSTGGALLRAGGPVGAPKANTTSRTFYKSTNLGVRYKSVNFRAKRRWCGRCLRRARHRRSWTGYQNPKHDISKSTPLGVAINLWKIPHVRSIFLVCQLVVDPRRVQCWKRERDVQGRDAPNRDGVPRERSP